MKGSKTTRTAIRVALALLISSLSAVMGMAETPAVEKGAATADSPGAVALEKAAKDNKYLFIFFYSGQDAHTGAMNGVFQTAMEKLADRADSIAIHLADPAEKPIVDKYGVRGSPMPMVLAIAPTGAATRGFPKQFNEAQLQQAFVSPCTAKCMKAIMDRHSILLCVQNDETQFGQEALAGAESFKADPQNTKGTDVIMLDPADEAEQPFLKSLQVDPKTKAAVTLLVTPPGAPVARFVGAVSKTQIETTVKQVNSSCGPSCNCHK